VNGRRSMRFATLYASASSSPSSWARESGAVGVSAISPHYWQEVLPLGWSSLARCDRARKVFAPRAWRRSARAPTRSPAPGLRVSRRALPRVIERRVQRDACHRADQRIGRERRDPAMELEHEPARYTVVLIERAPVRIDGAQLREVCRAHGLRTAPKYAATERVACTLRLDTVRGRPGPGFGDQLGTRRARDASNVSRSQTRSWPPRSSGVKGSQVQILSSRRFGEGPLNWWKHQVSGPLSRSGLISDSSAALGRLRPHLDECGRIVVACERGLPFPPTPGCGLAA
jgi:hypothetical protein